MVFRVTLPKLATGTNVDCNNEAGTFSGNKIVPLWSTLRLLLSGPIHSPSEVKFLETWREDGFLSPDAKAAMVVNQNIVGDGIVVREFKEALRGQRSKLRETSERATLYKHFFAAALYSARDQEQVVSMLAFARELLEIDDLVATLISDALLTALPLLPYDCNSLTQDEREAILAIIFIALNADSQKHIFELNACRVTMASLSLLSVDNNKLGMLTRKPIPELLPLLSISGRLVALLNTLRMVVADGHIQEDEKRLVRRVADLLSVDQVKTLKRIALLECGKSFDL